MLVHPQFNPIALDLGVIQIHWYGLTYLAAFGLFYWLATRRIRQAANQQGFSEVDHVELFGPAAQAGASSRNFVLCPGNAYDRSPCGTGTSAKLACLAVDGELAEGDMWIQESILGSKFTGQFRWLNRERGEVIPIITGSAHVNAEATLLLNERDPFCWGIR